MELTRTELNEIKGGIFKIKFFVIGGLITFIIGVIDGIVRPLKCN